MTDRHTGYVIALDKDFREDDAQEIITALKMVKGVIGVEPIIGGSAIVTTEMAVQNRVKQKLFEHFSIFFNNLFD